MSITLRYNGLPDGKTRKHLKQLIENVGESVFGFSEKTIALLKRYVDKCFESDFLPGRICGTWEQPHSTAAALKISTRALSYKECELEDAGLIVRTGTAHASRTEKRVGDKIVYLAGINLGPLIDRYAELEDMLERQKQQDDLLPLIRLQISEGRAKVRALGDPKLIAIADELSCGGRTKRITNFERLSEIKSALAVLAIDRNHKLRSDHPFFCSRSSGALFMMSCKSFGQVNLNGLLMKIQGYSEEIRADGITPLAARPLCRERKWWCGEAS
jgi:replication initiation protein RepC